MPDIIGILETQGPLTGKELIQETGKDVFALWAACNCSEQIITRIIGNRYLRLDRQIEGYARLSPSIMREFLGYTVIGAEKHGQNVLLKAELLQKEIRDVSKKKFELAQKTIQRVVDDHKECALINQRVCFMIAGDVVYDMAHAEPRPEASTGELVKGSDLDIIVILNHLPEQVKRSLDSAIYQEKHKLLMNPSSREEIDYIVKDLFKVQDQLQFKDFKSMVASKILDESRFLFGSRDLFHKIKNMLLREGIPEKILALEKEAILNREHAESYLLNAVGNLSEEEAMKYFYTTEEKEEIY